MTSSLTVLIGATGFTGGLIAEQLAKRRVEALLLGRDEARVKELGQRLGLPWRRIDGLGEVAGLLRRGDLLLHAAGPYRSTCPPALQAALEAGAHYLDLSGEVDTIAEVAGRNAEARAAGSMLLPAAGFEVAASDCLLAALCRGAGQVARVRVAVSGLDAISRGSALSSLAELGRLPRAVRGRRLVTRPAGPAPDFDFGGGPTPTLPVSWPDLATAPWTSGAPQVDTYYAATAAFRALERINEIARMAPAGWLEPLAAATARLVPSPAPDRIASNRGVACVEIDTLAGQTLRGRVETPEVYAFSAEVVARIAERVAGGDVEVGFQTPGRLYGPGLVRSAPGVTWSLSAPIPTPA